MAHDHDSADVLVRFAGELADAFLETVSDGGEGMLVHIAPAADGWNIGVRDLEGAPPADLLLGFVAPDEWVALGVATGGWAHPLDVAPSVATRRQRVAVATIVLRAGPVVGRMRMGDEVLRTPPAYGLSLDALQRALRLPTAPPLHPTGVLFATSWLAQIVRPRVPGTTPSPGPRLGSCTRPCSSLPMGAPTSRASTWWTRPAPSSGSAAGTS